MHIGSLLVLTLAALGWLSYDLGDWQGFQARCRYLGQLLLLTVFCFVGIHLVNSIPTQVQANNASPTLERP